MATLKGGNLFSARLQLMAAQIAKGDRVRVGFLENATYVDGKPVAMIAAIQEFGAPAAGIPPRPYFRNMIRAKKDEWPAGIAAALKKTRYDSAAALDLVGEAVAGQLRESIQELESPPLKPATIVKKGGHAGMVYDAKDASTFPAKPLVHTGHMLGSVDHEVRAKA